MTRIVAGAAGGRKIAVPPRGTRPTSERVREALFSRLDHLGVVNGARVLDLYAGSGALGIEAASRGASEVVLVESGREAALVCRRNVHDLGLDARVAVSRSTVERHLAGAPPHAFDLVLADPPYEVGAATLAGWLAQLDGGGWLAPGALVVIERARRDPAPPWPESWLAQEPRAYGDTALHTALAPVA